MRSLAPALWVTLACAAPAFPAALAPAGVIAEVGFSGAPLGLELETKASRPLDAAALRRDVRKLWGTGRYSDIQVAWNEARRGVYFELQREPRYSLRSVRFEPSNESRELGLEKGAAVDRGVARRMADELRQDLLSRGFRDARVEAELAPADAGRADLLFRVHSGEKVRVSQVLLEGPLRKQVAALKPMRVLPGWRLSKAFTSERLAEDLLRLRSSLLADGRFDSQVRPSIEGSGKDRVNVAFEVDAGPRYQIDGASLTTLDGLRLDLTPEDGRFPAKSFCDALFDERASAERAGRLDFTAEIEIRPLPPAEKSLHRAIAGASVHASDPYRVRWIKLDGAPSFRDATLRKAMRLDEGDLLNLSLLRRSLARLNRFSSLQPVFEKNVTVTEVPPGWADLSIRLAQQSPRRWTIAGPLGPMALFGPIHGRLETRLPAWGRGLLELSTYTVGGWLTSAPQAVLEADGWAWKTVWRPSLVLSRPSMPGHAWTSGYLWSPQLSLEQTLFANGAMRFRSHLGSLLDGAPPEPPLEVVVRDVERGVIGSMTCSQGRAWTDYLRQGGKVALAVAGL